MVEIEGLIAVISLAVLVAIFNGPWQRFCTDAARQVMFRKRDALFDMALSGELDFESDLYRISRKKIESAIRFAHELNLSEFVLFSRYELPSRSRYSKVIEAHKASPVVDKVKAAVVDSHVTLLLMMLAKSPLGVILAPAILFLVVAAKMDNALAWLGQRRSITPLISTVSAEAEFA